VLKHIKNIFLRRISMLKKFPPIIPGFPNMLHGGDYNPEQWKNTPEI